jgi:transposase
MQMSILGIDLGKNSCSVVGLDAGGKVVLRRAMRRETVIVFCSKLPSCIIAMEACCGAHHMGRVLAQQGHEIRLMSPEYVRPYVKSQKNDDRDAEGIAEAASRPTMRFVELKSQDQLDMQSLHRVRDRLISQRTSLINQIRALLLERGYIMPQGKTKLAKRLTELLEEGASDLAPRIVSLIKDMRDQWLSLDQSITSFDDEFAQQAHIDDSARRLLSIPGIGALNATALVASIGDAATFARGRDLAAWLGLVPRQVTTGGKPRLVGITKRGDKYLRKMLVQGARSAFPTLSKSPTALGAWLRGLLSRAHTNKVVVALAAKIARIIWALLRHKRVFESAIIMAN